MTGEPAATLLQPDLGQRSIRDREFRPRHSRPGDGSSSLCNRKPQNMSDRTHASMLEATRLTRAGRLSEAMAFLRRALGSEPGADTAPDHQGETPNGSVRRARTIDGMAETIAVTPHSPDPRPGQKIEIGLGDHPDASREGLSQGHLPEALRSFLDRVNRKGLGPGLDGLAKPAPVPVHVPDGAKFVEGSYGNHAGSRSYKLYVPSGDRGQALPLVVMLHGCTQSPDDFAAGTRMNMLAEEHGCLIVYPAQAASANQSRCWNWFSPSDQERDQGEPSLIAGITRQIMRDYPVDPQRVYVAGLSAGGAAAAIMAATYPDLYAAVGVHSGLAYRAAGDLPSAFAAMQQGGGGRPMTGATAGGERRLVPTIVFHGDQDETVHPRNGDHVIAQTRTATATGLQPTATVQHGQAPGGRAYSRTVHADTSGGAILEQWVVHGAGHAWSGGSTDGSFTDPRGPDASREMLRFFLEHPHRPARGG